MPVASDQDRNELQWARDRIDMIATRMRNAANGQSEVASYAVDTWADELDSVWDDLKALQLAQMEKG